MAKSGCTPENLDPAIILHNRHFEHSGIISLATGSLLGQFFEGQILVNSGKLNSSQWHWHKTSFILIVGRTILSFAIFVPCMALHYLLPSVVYQMRDDVP